MTILCVYKETGSDTLLSRTEDFAEIAETLNAAGVNLERWQADQDLDANADNDMIIAAYQAEIDRLVAEHGYQTWDVVSMNPDHPDKEVFRKKFLDEHTHSEDEVRFFVRGQGLFVLHIEDKVYSILCEKNDLISVPKNTRHWFDMGPNPVFTAIRLFNNPEGWVAQFTGNDIASRFPLLEN